MPSLYDFPAAYDAVMNRPEAVVETEAHTVIALLAQHGITQGKILELASGASAHGLRLAGQGFQVTGLDRSAAMLAEAQRRAQAAGVALRTVQGDVVDFALEEGGFDAALFLFETFPLITATADIYRHFAAVRRSLRRGGVYIVDIDRSYGIRTAQGEWGRRTAPLPNGQVEFWHADEPGDWVEGVNRLALHCRIALDDATYTTADVWVVRHYTPWMLVLLVETLPGWTLDGFYSWQQAGREIAQEAHYFMLLVAA
jgi:hypothetical protein